jgi:hypothetical protein
MQSVRKSYFPIYPSTPAPSVIKCHSLTPWETYSRLYLPPSHPFIAGRRRPFLANSFIMDPQSVRAQHHYPRVTRGHHSGSSRHAITLPAEFEPIFKSGREDRMGIIRCSHPSNGD